MAKKIAQIKKASKAKTVTAEAVVSLKALRPKVLKFNFTKTNSWANVKLLWNKAPKTCAAIVNSLNKNGEMKVKSVHGRNSGSEALFLTPKCLPLGDENTILNYKTGDVCFGFEPKGICSHAKVDCSEVAWAYGGDV